MIRPRISAVASWTLALALAAPGCDLVPRKVTADDCVRWNEHNAAVLKREFGAAIRRCDADLVATMTKDMESGVDHGMREDVDNCRKQAAQGARVIPKEVACFLAGDTLADWKACNFTMPTFKVDSLQAEIAKIDDYCTKGNGRRGSASLER